MAATEEKPDTNASEKGWLSTAWDYANFAGLAISNPSMAWQLMKAGSDPEVKANLLRSAGTPSDMVFAEMGKMEYFQSDEGKKALGEIQDDKKFVSALNKAIQNDSTVADGISGKATENGNTLDISSLAVSLTDERRRSVITQVLDKVGENDNDKFNFAYMTDIATAAGNNDMKQVQSLLAKGGMQDDNVDLAANMSLSDALKDPKAFGQNMSKLMGLTGEQAKSFSGLFEMLGKFFQMIMGNPNDPNSISYFMDKHGAGMKRGFENITGMTDTRLAEEAKTGKHTYDGDIPRPKKEENPDVKVADSSRATSNFNDVAKDTPTETKVDIAPAQPGFMERYAAAQVNAAKYGMGA